MTQSITLIHYKDSDGTMLLEAAEMRGSGWCLAGCTDDIHFDFAEIISTTVVHADSDVQHKTPNSKEYNPSPEYLRELIENSGLSQRAAARQIGISERSMREYLSLTNRKKKASYAIQFALESLGSI